MADGFGIQAGALYRPHVTLGYFANVHVAQAAHAKLAEWIASAASQVSDLRLRFRSASIYGFTSLVEFVRC
jgi:2'-5' RNA ligase